MIALIIDFNFVITIFLSLKIERAFERAVGSPSELDTNTTISQRLYHLEERMTNLQTATDTLEILIRQLVKNARE